METNRSESTESGIRSPEIGGEEAALLKVLSSSFCSTRGILARCSSMRIATGLSAKNDPRFSCHWSMFVVFWYVN